MVCDFMLNARQCHSLKSMGYSNVPMPCFKLLKEKQKEKQLKKKFWIIYPIDNIIVPVNRIYQLQVTCQHIPPAKKII